MRKLLQEISVIPGVTGSCIFDKKEGPLCKDLHPDLSEDLLQTVGIHLVRLIQMGKMSGLSVKSVHFRFDKYTVVGMPLETGAVLLTICEAHANCSLVATTAAMLAADMRDELERGVHSPEIEESVEELGEVVLDGSVDAELQPMYDKIEQALAGAIGPVAGMIIQDYIHKWKESGPEVPARLTELASMLTKEIGDPALEREFTARIEEIM
ncbi:MAG: hypothetical protein U9P36_13750 [Thermodesulfobacteriota bacterium]|nr:hypothetical protein [Thermodesulfobacteriota bacterium]